MQDSGMNLMEGAHRIGKNEYKHFVSISKGSCGEVKYQLLLSRDLGYMKDATYDEMAEAYENKHDAYKAAQFFKITDTVHGHGEWIFLIIVRIKCVILCV